MVQSALLAALVFWAINTVDRLLAWQTFARPIVAAPLTGLVLGDLNTGIIMGASLEAIFMGISAIGGSIPSDPLSSAIIAVAFTIISGSDAETGLALAMPIGILIASFNAMVNPILALFAPYWENLAASGNMKAFNLQTITFSILFDRLANTIVLFLGIAYGVEGLQKFLASLPAFVTKGLGASSSMMTAVGFAILTSMIWNKELGGFFFVGFVLSTYLKLGPLPIAIFGAVVSIMYFYNDKKILDTVKASKKDVKSGEDFF